jgi:hypothetical protein
MKQRPKVIGDWYSMFIAIPLETDRDGPAAFVDVDEFHAEQAMSAGEIIPVADALSCTEQQCEDAFVTAGNRRADEVLRGGRIERLVNLSWHAPTELCHSPANRGVATGGAVAPFPSEIWGNRVGPLEPRSRAIIQVAPNAEFKIRRQHA